MSIDNILLSSIDEFSVMLYNCSIKKCFDFVDLPFPDYKSADELPFCSTSLQVLNLGKCFETQGILFSFADTELYYLNSECRVLSDIFDKPFKRMRIHVHHKGLYLWFMRVYQYYPLWKDFSDYILNKLSKCTGSAEITDDFFAKISRLDIAFDVLNCNDAKIFFDLLLDSVEKFPITTVNGKIAHCKTIRNSLLGSTLYIGADTAERKIRIYDKLKERGFFDQVYSGDAIQPYPFIVDLVNQGEIIKSWLRFEIECRRDQAGQYLLSNPKLGTFLSLPDTAFYHTFNYVTVLDKEDDKSNKVSSKRVINLKNKFLNSLCNESCRELRFNDHTTIIQNEYSEQNFYSQRFIKNQLEQICINAQFGNQFTLEKNSYIIHQLLDPDSPETRWVNSYCSRHFNKLRLVDCDCFVNFNENGFEFKNCPDSVIVNPKLSYSDFLEQQKII